MLEQHGEKQHEETYVNVLHIRERDVADIIQVTQQLEHMNGFVVHPCVMRERTLYDNYNVTCTQLYYLPTVRSQGEISTN